MGGWAQNGVLGGKILGMKDYHMEVRVEGSWCLHGLSLLGCSLDSENTTSGHM